MFSLAFGSYTLFCTSNGLPPNYAQYTAHATLVEEFGNLHGKGQTSFIAVNRGTAWPFLVIAQSYSPSGHGFYPGAALVPETGLLFVGAGERLLAYDLKTPRRLWSDTVRSGFWSWTRHNDAVVMAAETELAAWTLQGVKLWTMPVEPPWDYHVRGTTVELDVAGSKTAFELYRGPER